MTGVLILARISRIWTTGCIENLRALGRTAPGTVGGMGVDGDCRGGVAVAEG